MIFPSPREIRRLSEADPEQQVGGLRELVGRGSLENAGMLVFDRRLGCLDLDHGWATQMVEDNKEIFQ